MTYSPKPGTAAFRILGWLEAQGATREFTASQIAEALGLTSGTVPSYLESALAAHLLFSRRRDYTHPKAPVWYSLTDHSPPPALNWRPKADDVPTFRGRSVEKETPQGDQPRSERGREVMEPEACESADGRGTTGAPALATLPQHASPGVGPMGAGQPADAGPTGGVAT